MNTLPEFSAIEKRGIQSLRPPYVVRKRKETQAIKTETPNKKRRIEKIDPARETLCLCQLSIPNHSHKQACPYFNLYVGFGHKTMFQHANEMLASECFEKHPLLPNSFCCQMKSALIARRSTSAIVSGPITGIVEWFKSLAQDGHSYPKCKTIVVDCAVPLTNLQKTITEHIKNTSGLVLIIMLNHLETAFNDQKTKAQIISIFKEYSPDNLRIIIGSCTSDSFSRVIDDVYDEGVYPELHNMHHSKEELLQLMGSLLSHPPLFTPEAISLIVDKLDDNSMESPIKFCREVIRKICKDDSALPLKGIGIREVMECEDLMKKEKN